MKIKYFLVLFVLVVSASSCVNQRSGKNKKTSSFDNGKQVIDSLDHLFQELYSIEPGDGGYGQSTISINENIRKVVEQITMPKLLEEAFEFYPQKKHNYTLIQSSDRKFVVFSWEIAKIGGTYIRNVALYVENDALVPTSLYGSPAIYDKIFILNTENNTQIYILSGRGASNLNRYTLNAYSIKKDGIEEVRVFPNNQSYLETIPQTKKVAADTSLSFKVMSYGKQILIPKIMDSVVVYEHLSFDGKRFVLDTQE